MKKYRTEVNKRTIYNCGPYRQGRNYEQLDALVKQLEKYDGHSGICDEAEAKQALITFFQAFRDIEPSKEFYPGRWGEYYS